MHGADAGSPRRVRIAAGAAVMLVVAAVALTIFAVQFSARRGDAETDLQNARAEMYGLSRLDWQAIAQAVMSEEQAVLVRQRRAEFLAIMRRVDRQDGDRPTVARVVSGGERYIRNYDLEVRRLKVGDRAGARLVEDQLVEPAFRDLEAEVDHAIADAQHAARQALTLAIMAAATLVPLVAFGAMWLARREGRRAAQRNVERAAQLSAQRFEAMVRGASDLVLVTSAAGEVEYASPASVRMLGCEPAELSVAAFRDRISLDDRIALRGAMEEVSAGPDREATLEVRVHRADGRWRTLECRLRNAYHDPGVGGVVWNIRDVTERRELEGQLSHQAFHDELTGLANRALLADRLGRALPRAARGGVGVGVIVIDLDSFKDVNDSLGHPAGDEVLIAAAERLRSAARAQDTVARLGGDEFVLVVEDAPSVQTVLDVAQRSVALLAQPTLAGGREVRVTASAGLAYADGAQLAGSHAGDALVRDADVAMYAAKARGKGQAVVFETTMRANVQSRLELLLDVGSAAARGEIGVVYQPLIDLKTRSVVGFEALARWNHPTRGELAPGSFIGLAEETEAILEIGRKVLRTAANQAAAWNDLDPGAGPLAMSVNLSPRQLGDPALVSDVRAALLESGLPAQLLVLEITESAVVQDVGLARERLHQLRALGVRIAMDDFGTGHSSLSYLRRLPIDILKIDKSFVDDQDGRGPVLLATVANLGTTLGLTTVAEGIETVHQLRQVRDAGCTLGQGYLFARPMAAGDALSFLRTRPDRHEEPDAAPTYPGAATPTAPSRLG